LVSHNVGPVPLSLQDRVLVGRKLKALRIEAGLQQRQAAVKCDLSVGTIQAAETNKWPVGVENLDRYAALFGTTVHDILAPPPPAPPPAPDPLVVGLNREHLVIARKYALALRDQRAAVEQLLDADERASEVFARVVQWLVTCTPEQREELVTLVGRGDLLTAIAKAVQVPETEPLLRKWLETAGRIPLAPEAERLSNRKP